MISHFFTSFVYFFVIIGLVVILIGYPIMLLWEDSISKLFIFKQKPAKPTKKPTDVLIAEQRKEIQTLKADLEAAKDAQAKREGEVEREKAYIIERMFELMSDISKENVMNMIRMDMFQKEVMRLEDQAKQDARSLVLLNDMVRNIGLNENASPLEIAQHEIMLAQANELAAVAV